MKNKWLSWEYDAKYTNVRRKIKRKTHKRERYLAKIELKKAMKEEKDW
ncbi:MAG: hypothetical protein ACP5QP_07295 [Brevinematia bacterium]